MKVISSCVIKNREVILNGQRFFFDLPEIPAKDFLINVYRKACLEYPKFFKMDNLSKAGFLASSLMMQNTEYDNVDPKTDFGIILQNNVSSLDTDFAYQKTIQPDNFFPSPALFVYTLPNIVTGEIAIRYKIFGETIFFVSKKYDEKSITHYLNYLFENDLLRTAIVGWVDCLNEYCEVDMKLVER